MILQNQAKFPNENFACLSADRERRLAERERFPRYGFPHPRNAKAFLGNTEEAVGPEQIFDLFGISPYKLSVCVGGSSFHNKIMK